ncbi:CBO0543 family protein [Halobacillus dabanensis]|uniref:CBO0543 family protein n=1 Tax=Halobacillus dabanensis TaxID=240302 RepID=UPI002446F7AC|nr:CBO0543 family protein [Halobacillus dabanensis]
MILAFVLPWTFGILHLYRKDKKVIPLIGSIFSIMAFIINEMGLYFGFWEVAPFPKQKTLSVIPFNMGVYPILASYLIFFIKCKGNPYIIILLMTLFTTALECIYVLLGRVVYGNGWNLLYTFISYLIPYIIIYQYHLFLSRFMFAK